MKYLDMDTWNRIEHFKFFSSFDEPFFSLVTNVDCSNALNYSRSTGVSFFALYLHNSLKAVNEIEEFRYRINEGRVIVYDIINASPTIGRGDGTFGIGFIPYSPKMEDFIIDLEKAKATIKGSSGIMLNKETNRSDVIQYSSIPWVSFTDLSHPRNYNTGDSIPKISFGKVTELNGRFFMPVSVFVHHGLMDAYHIGRFFKEFEMNMSNINQIRQ